MERELQETRQRLAAVKEQLRLQTRRARQLVAACTAKVADKDREIEMLRTLKDGQLQAIVSKLLHFECRLRQEQKRIGESVQAKDRVIRQQKQELEQLRQANRKLLMAAAKEDDPMQDQNGKIKLCKLETTMMSPIAAAAADQQQQQADESQDKENVTSSSSVAVLEQTPLVTKMVRRFQAIPSATATALTTTTAAAAAATNGKKPQVPKKPARLLKSLSSLSDGLVAVASDCCHSIAGENQRQNINNTNINNNSNSPVAATTGLRRVDSVNDGGYFTLEKRKPANTNTSTSNAKMTVTTVAAVNAEMAAIQMDVSADEMDARHHHHHYNNNKNFIEEYHLDSLEEEELTNLLQPIDMEVESSPPPAPPALLVITSSSSSSACQTTPVRPKRLLSPKREDRRYSGDGTEWSDHLSSSSSTSSSSSAVVSPRTPPPPPPDEFSCVSSDSVLLPQLGDSTPVAVQYERFIDCSGLMQKSILTPSRLLSNHKNMLKPKDVKHRNKVKAAAVQLVNCRTSSSSALALAADAAAAASHEMANHRHVHQSNNQVRYYIEPFL